jgi:nucleoid-associated protein YgaU
MNMADQAALEQKYAPVGQVITDFSEYGAQNQGVAMDGDKLVFTCSVPSKVIGNRVWDAIKQCDASYSDLELKMTQTGADAQPYTIKAGDNLSKVSELFYGKASNYMKIAEANNMVDANKIQVGQAIEVPALD